MDPVVTTTSGTVRGATAAGVVRFLGVPYAAAPFGPNRFRPARPAPRWDGVRDAVTMGATAPSPGYAGGIAALLPEPVVAGEDCLTANVWAPEGADGLPVMVWIHGGAFVHGSNAVPVYDGTAFARDGVVLVSINYRLGSEGFLLLPGGTANLGLLDQVAALRWVRENAGAFGGDPTQVTIFGESAGAMSVACLLAMPAAEGLFRRAILQSGAGQHAMSRETATLVAGHLAEEVGVHVDRLADVPPERLVAGQVALSTQLQTAPDPTRWREVAANGMLFHPVIDGDVLPALPLERIAAGASSDVEIMIGTNRDEMRLFMAIGPVLDAITDEALAGLAASFRLPAGAVVAYRGQQLGGSAGDAAADLVGDWFFRIPAVRLAEAHGSAHVYEFDWPTPVLTGRLRSCHAVELGFVFDTLDAAADLSGPDASQKLAAEVHAGWVAFATTGDPGWERYGEQRRVRRLGEVVETVTDPRGETRVLWDGVR